MFEAKLITNFAFFTKKTGVFLVINSIGILVF